MESASKGRDSDYKSRTRTMNRRFSFITIFYKNQLYVIKLSIKSLSLWRISNLNCYDETQDICSKQLAQRVLP